MRRDSDVRSLDGKGLAEVVEPFVGSAYDALPRDVREKILDAWHREARAGSMTPIVRKGRVVRPE